MSLINILRSGVFDETLNKTVDNDKDGSYSITITPNKINGSDAKAMQVTGVLQNSEGLSMGVKAEWDRLRLFDDGGGIVGSVVSFVESVGRWAGYGITDSGIATRKYYTSNGSYLNITPEFRVVDWEGTGQPVLAALLLFNLCLPARLLDDGTVQKVNDVVNNAKEWLKKQDSPLMSMASALKDNSNGNKVIETLAQATDIEGHYGLSVDNLADSITKSPVSVSVRIGNYFSHNEMVIDKVDVQFSREVTKMGPLYADFSVGLSSLQAMVCGTNGFAPAATRALSMGA